MIELASIAKTYKSDTMDTPVLNEISFRIEKGEYVAVVGASGTGKTTLMNIVGCLDRPSSGTYTLDGADVGNIDDRELSAIRNRKIGFVFQQFHLLERSSALRNVLLPLVYADAYPADAEERARRLLEAVGLSDRVNYKPGELSGGQQQRVAIARALVNDPAILLADEPTGNLDTDASREIMEIFNGLHAEGRTIVVITHDEEVAGHAKRVLKMVDGRIADDRRTGAQDDGRKEEV
jgi:putative ABC transport system ATP-binding protein